MSDKVSVFIKAFLDLTAAEKKQVIEVAKALEGAAGPINESRIMKSFGLESLESGTTINFAPIPGSSCPACGR